MKRILLMLACALTLSLQAQTLRVAAAGNLRFILEEIKTNYAAVNPKVKLEVIYGASGALTQQIMNGAAFDFFMAADITFPQKLKAQGYASGEVKTYAFGKLVLWSNTLDVSKGMNVLKDATRIAIAKPDIAPYGAKAIESLRYYGLFEQVKSKLVYADNIAQAAQYAASGNAEVAIIANALIYGPEMKDKGHVYYPDTRSYKPVEQACVLIKGWERNPEAARFMKYVLSAACRPVFEKYGFIVP